MIMRSLKYAQRFSNFLDFQLALLESPLLKKHNLKSNILYIKEIHS